MADTTKNLAQPHMRLDNLLDLLRSVFLDAIYKSNDILQIVEHYVQELHKHENIQKVRDDELQIFYDFIDGVKGCLQYRRKTFSITNSVTYINITLLYIIVWLNGLGKGIDVFLISRRKALESDLLKILKKSMKNDYSIRTGCYSSNELSANIRDRFGVLFVVLNKLGSIPRIYEIYNSAILGILCGKNLKLKIDFITWVKNHARIPMIDKQLILNVLEIPFAVEHSKDFIKEPKPTNNYRTLQCTLRIEMYSEILPGCMVEIQIRDEDMHKDAISGSASHKNYKEEFDGPEFEGVNLEKLANVFNLDALDNINIPGFTKYEPSTSSEIDLREVTNPGDWDGILYPKVFFDRHVSPNLVNL